MSHSMGLAAPGYLEQRPSMHLCLVGQRQLGHTYWHQSSHIQTMSSEAFFLVPRIWKFVIGLIQDMAHCTWPYHVSRWQQRTDVISLMPSFCSSQAEGVLSLVFDAADPTDHGTVIAAKPLHFRVIWSPRFATMEHSRVNTGPRVWPPLGNCKCWVSTPIFIGILHFDLNLKICCVSIP